MSEIIHFKRTPVTKIQTDHIDRLAGDLCYNRATRNLNVSEIVKRNIKFLDELSLDEAGRVIEQFIIRRGY